jgi:hypothetical protein
MSTESATIQGSSVIAVLEDSRALRLGQLSFWQRSGRQVLSSGTKYLATAQYPVQS